MKIVLIFFLTVSVFGKHEEPVSYGKRWQKWRNLKITWENGKMIVGKLESYFFYILSSIPIFYLLMIIPAVSVPKS